MSNADKENRIIDEDDCRFEHVKLHNIVLRWKRMSSQQQHYCSLVKRVPAKKAPDNFSLQLQLERENTFFCVLAVDFCQS